jgi:hypothetical protein
VRYVRHNLDSDEVRNHIAGGKSATRLALTWNDRVSFVLTEQLQVKKLAFLDLIKEDAERQAENADDLFAANFTLMCGELSQLAGAPAGGAGRRGRIAVARADRLPAAGAGHAGDGDADGVDVGKPSAVRNLVPAGALEKQAAQEYEQLKRQAASKQALGPDDHPQVKRLRGHRGAHDSLRRPLQSACRQWQWEVNLIGSKQINAFCMPGGKIAFYTGILDTLKLTDDEVAMVMGHEIAHALREHARERMAKAR